MTCKISFIKSMLETLKHHIASIFAVCVIFFIQLIIFFLNIQNVSSVQVLSSGPIMHYDRIIEMTLPGAAYAIPIIFVAILLGFDFFKYLHSKKQTDFYDSLPFKRNKWFLLRISCAFMVFIIPYLLCTLLEMTLLVLYGFTTFTFFSNLFWNFVCMILIFAITFFTTVLSMIITGHHVIAAFSFCIFSAYAPILLRYIYPSYANEYFKTYVTEDSFLQYFEYLSPIGLTHRLLNSSYLDWTAKDHFTDFIILIALILISAFLSFLLFCKRPSESAGHAMAFEKFNPVIRVILVIPMTLYIGLYLSLIASIAQKGWMIFGFLIGTFLLHGIIESIFQFDIRGMKTHKKQMVLCFSICVGVALIFWYDIFHYDKYIPQADEIDSLIIRTDNYYIYHENPDGIASENYEDALCLAENLIKQDLDVHPENECIVFTYQLKNGAIKKREYYMNVESNKTYLDKIFSTKEYKDDVCPLYTEDWSQISYIEWSDSLKNYTLFISKEEMDHLFETYIAEYTPFTYSDTKKQIPVGSFIVCFEEENDYHDFQCFVYPQFTQTISLLEKHLSKNELTKEYGSITEPLLDKYPIASVEIYLEDYPLLISDKDIIEQIKEHLMQSTYFYKMSYSKQWEDYYEASVNFAVEDGYGYVSYMIPKDIANTLKTK